MSGWLATVDEALDVAREHWRWEQQQRGTSHIGMFAMLGRRPPARRIGDDDDIELLAEEWRELRHERKAA
jgi:hypothetical protein